MEIVLWELHSPSDLPARCVYRSALDLPHVVVVAVCETEPINEHVHSEAEAIDEGRYLFDDFTDRGWTIVIYRDPRLNRVS